MLTIAYPFFNLIFMKKLIYLSFICLIVSCSGGGSSENGDYTPSGDDVDRRLILDNINLTINKGDCIGFTTKSLSDTNLNSSISYNENKISCNVLKVEKGAEFNQLNTMAINQLFNTQFTPATSSNRMAYTLEHNIKSLNAHEITSGNVQTGTVQLTPSGKVIVLMRDAQTTGGYARVLQLTPMAINQLSQKRPGEKVTFELLKKG